MTGGSAGKYPPKTGCSDRIKALLSVGLVQAEGGKGKQIGRGQKCGEPERGGKPDWNYASTEHEEP